jgi:hypothetical protein
MTDLPKVRFYAAPRTMTALTVLTGRTGLTNTDTLNRATQAYASLTGLPLWQAVRVLLFERAAVRRLAASVTGCETCGDPMLPRELAEHARAAHGDS